VWEPEIIGWWIFTIRSYLILEKWHPYPIGILFWLKPYYPYPKTFRKCIMMHNIHFCAVSILPHEAKQLYEAKQLLELFCLQLNMIGWSSQLTSLERMSCLADHDICNSSVPSMNDCCHGFRAGKQLLICIKSVVPKLFLITYHLLVL